MTRRVLVALLLFAGVGSVYLARQTAGPRGAKFTLYAAPGWTGDVLKTWTSRHIDHGSALRRNKVALPDDSSLRATGWVYIPRRGEYLFEVESDDDNWLFIDDSLVCSNRGGRKPKPRARQLERGFHAFRLDTHHKKGRYKTLVRWKLPAGYMDLESIPPYFIHPESSPSSQVSLLYRWLPCLLFFLAAWLGLSPFLRSIYRRLRSDRGYRIEIMTGFALCCLAFGVRTIDVNGAGETCDEWAYSMAGQIYVSNAAHGYFESTYWNSNDEHPPVGKYIYGLASHLAGSDDFGTLRLTSAFMNALTVLMTFFIALRLFSLPVAVTSALILSLLPHFVAHGKVAGLDSPSALLYTFTVALFLRAARRDAVSNSAYLMAGLMACLAFATKFSNATVFLFMVAVYLYREWPDLRSKGAMRLPVSLYLLPVLPLLVLFLIWPWLWREPFGQLVQTLSHWNYPITEWFLGQYVTPPVYYYPVYLVATIPAALLLPFIMFFVRFRNKAPESTGDGDNSHRNRLTTVAGGRVIVCFWFFSALLWSFSSFKQDGIRYIYTAMPAIAMICGAGLEHLIRQKKTWWPATWVTLSGYMVWQLATVHPYYLDYYNELVGGTETVWENRLLEVGWWGEGIPAAVTHVNSVSHYGATWSQRGVVTHTFYGLRDDLVAVEKNPDYLIWSNIRPEEMPVDGYDIDYQVIVDGAPVAVVFIKNSTLKEMRLGLDPTDDTDVPYSDLGASANPETRANSAKERAAKAPQKSDATPPAGGRKTAPKDDATDTAP